MATVEMEVTDRRGLDWKSPLRKLAKSFQRSRDAWKAKYMAKRRQCRRMDSQLRAVEKSRAKWIEAAQQARQQIRELERELEQHKNFPA